jgi:hypothetical protein
MGPRQETGSVRNRLEELFLCLIGTMKARIHPLIFRGHNFNAGASVGFGIAVTSLLLRAWNELMQAINT